MSAFIATAFAQETPEAESVQWRAVTDQIRPKVSKLAAIMDDAETDVLDYLTFPKPGFPSCSPFDDRAADEAIIKRRFARAACRMVRTGDGKRASGRAGSRGA